MSKLLAPILVLYAEAASGQSSLLEAINAARVMNSVLPVRQDSRLDRAAGLQVEWVSYAAKKNISTPDHLCSTKWLIQRHPELLWGHLLATFPDGLPDWLGAFDLGRLCGYNGLCLDNGSYGSRKMSPVDGWLASPFGHRDNLLDPDWTDVGIAGPTGVGAGNFATWAIFGSE